MKEKCLIKLNINPWKKKLIAIKNKRISLFKKYSSPISPQKSVPQPPKKNCGKYHT